MSDFASDVDSEPGGPSLPSGFTQTCQISLILTVCCRCRIACRSVVREYDGDVRFRQ